IFCPEGAQQISPGQRPGDANRSTKPCKGGTTRSIPNIPFVELHPVALEQGAELVLKRHLPMMFFLVFNVLLYFRDAGLTHRECSVSGLPVKVGIPGSITLHPLRTSLLHFLDDFLEGVVPGKREQGVDMIVDAPDHERWALPLLINARLIREETF